MGDVFVEIAHLLDNIIDDRLGGQDDLAALDLPGETAASPKIDQQSRAPAVDGILGGTGGGDFSPAAMEEAVTLVG